MLAFKRNLLLALVTIITIILVVQFSVMDNKMANIPQPIPLSPGQKYIINCSLPEVPSEVPILEIIENPLSEESIKLLSEYLGLYTRTNGLYGEIVLKDDDRSLSIYGGNGLLYFTLSRPSLFKELPSYDEARIIADKFLYEVLQRYPFPQNLKINFIDVRPAETLTTRFINGSTIGPIVQSLGVNYALSYDGIKLWGPGADFNIVVGENGQIIRAELRWRWIKEAGSHKIITPEEAIEKLERGELYFAPITTQGGIVQQIELVYFVPHPDEEVRYLPICYMFKIVDSPRDTLPYIILVSATS